MEASLSFKEYVGARRRGRGPGSKVAWDFIVDAKSDSTLVDARSWTELRDYLWAEGACDGAIVAARKVWNSFQAKRRREGASA
jgi:hypothetical protein